MACTLNITSAVVHGGNIIITGSYSSTIPCPGTFDISLKVTFPDGSSCGWNSIIQTNVNIWSVSVPCAKPCGYGPVIIVASGNCTDINGIVLFNCSTTFTLPLLCCCPSSTTSTIYGTCNNNSQVVSFNTYVSIPDIGCTFSFRRNFGDGTFGNIYTFTGNGQFTIPTEQHSYAAPNTYVSVIEVIPPPQGCGIIDAHQVVVNCNNSPCYPSNFFKFLCEFFEFSFLLSSTVGIVLAIVLPPAAYLVYLGWFSAATTFLALFYIFKCDKCVCDPFTRAWGRIMISVGIILFMFILGGFSIPGPVAFAIGVVSIASGFIVLQVWYNKNHTICSLTFCDVWCLIGNNLITSMNNISAANLAITGALIVWLSASGAVWIPIVVVIIIWAFVTNKLKSAPCGNSTTKYICK